MKRVSADEFAEHADEYLEAGEQISVEKDGRVIGHYVPIPAAAPVNGAATNEAPMNGAAANGHAATDGRSRIDPEKHADMEWISRRLQEIYAETGLTEDEFADLFDTKKPFPYDNVPKP